MLEVVKVILDDYEFCFIKINLAGYHYSLTRDHPHHPPIFAYFKWSSTKYRLLEKLIFYLGSAMSITVVLYYRKQASKLITAPKQLKKKKNSQPHTNPYPSPVL